MPIKIPTLDDRRYQDLVNEAIARIPVHNPEWTNFNQSDPGVTIIELFAFMTENLLYRSNQIPERNRLKFLSLLGLELQPATSARGLVTLSNPRGNLETITLSHGAEVRAGDVPFRTENGLDILPIEVQVFCKKVIAEPSEELKSYYRQLFASYAESSAPEDFQLYETAALESFGAAGVDLDHDTIDRSLWIALLARKQDLADQARSVIAGKTLSLGIAPSQSDAGRRLAPGDQSSPDQLASLSFQIPKPPPGGSLPRDPSQRVPQYATLEASANTNVLQVPGIVAINLPSASNLQLWNNLEPLESGVGDFPPPLEDSSLAGRVITWLRVQAPNAAHASIRWAGINAAAVTQRTRVSNELLPPGTGEPDQVVFLSQTPVIPESVKLTVTPANEEQQQWQEIDDILSAPPEVHVPSLSTPGVRLAQATGGVSHVFMLNPESGEIKFGDGLRGKRPPRNAVVRADYDYSLGQAGNVGAGSINSSPTLPPGIKVGNPLPTWGGAEAETASQGEKHISSYLQHRDRLVTTSDYETIARRTPGVQVGRVDVLPLYNPDLGQAEPGDAPGAITLMVIPQRDPAHPGAPAPTQFFIDTIAQYLNSRRLITTEVFVRGPLYQSLWISLGIKAAPGFAFPEVREAVKQAVKNFLSPVPIETGNDAVTSATRGWPLGKAVVGLEVLVAASRVDGVLSVNPTIYLATGNENSQPQIDLIGLELPYLTGISVSQGEPVSLSELRGRSGIGGFGTGEADGTGDGDGGAGDGSGGDGREGDGTGGAGAGMRHVPVPVVPEECR